MTSYDVFSLVHEREIEEANVQYHLHYLFASLALGIISHTTLMGLSKYILSVCILCPSSPPTSPLGTNLPTFLSSHGSPLGNWAGPGVRSSADYPKFLS